MNATVAVAASKADTTRNCPDVREGTAWASQELFAAIDALAPGVLCEPDPTLEDVRVALQGTGFTWSAKGELVYSGERAALIAELDELIEMFGRDTSAAELFA